MRILFSVSKSVIYLKGDKEFEAVANYMWQRHHVDILEKYGIMDARNFSCNFLMKYNAEAVLSECNGVMFYYPLFK